MIWCVLFFYFFFLKSKSFLFFSSYFEFDSLSIFMGSICPLVLLLIYSVGLSLVSKENMYFFSYSFFFLVFFVFLCFFLCSPFHFIFSLEMCVFPMISLIFLFSKGFDKIISVFFMFLINIVGSLPFMIFFSLLDFNLHLNFSSTSLGLSNSSSLMILMLFLMVLICKIPMFTLHFWLTKAHVSASGTCSMILASLMLKLGTFGVLKFSDFFLKVSFKVLPLFFGIAIWGSFFIMMVMTRFFDMKYLIACSSIVHMAMILPLVSFNLSIGIFSSVFMMVGHGLVSFVLFYLVSVLYESSQNRSFDMNKSVESTFKILSMWIFVFLFLNMGVPPFLNFFSELLTFLTFLKFSYTNCITLFIIMMIPIMFCMQMVTKVIFSKNVAMTYNNPDSIVNNFMISYTLFLLFIPFLIF